MAIEQNCDEQHFSELTIHLVMSGLYNPKMIDCKGSYERLRDKQSVLALVEKGCDHKILLNCLAFARALPEYYPALDIAALARGEEPIGGAQRIEADHAFCCASVSIGRA